MNLERVPSLWTGTQQSNCWGIVVSGEVVQQGTEHRLVSVDSLNIITGDVYQVILRSADGRGLAWHAGQYLEIVMPEGSPCAYSIASAPAEDGMTLELHIQCYPGHQRAQEVIEYLRSGQVITINLPKGSCHIGDCPQAPLVFIAAGTGFAQMKAMIEQSFLNSHEYPLHLYWGVRRPSGFYMPSLPVHWSSEGVQYHPVVSEPEADDDWNGRHGLLYKAVLDDTEQLKGAHFYISGSPDMVYSTFDALVAEGFPAEHVHSDVFDYCPRA